MRLTNTEKEHIQQVRDYLDTHVALYISVQEMVTISTLSETKFTKGFKAIYGTSPYHYHLLKSMEHARMLLNNGMLVKEVAHIMGYVNAGSFTKAFKQVFGKAPQDFRWDDLSILILFFSLLWA